VAGPGVHESAASGSRQWVKVQQTTRVPTRAAGCGAAQRSSQRARGIAALRVAHVSACIPLPQGTPFPEATLKLWLCQMLLALEYLQVQKVLHR
jgi:hypothetical protein